MAEITLPQLGETVTEGTITRWFKKVGDTIAADFSAAIATAGQRYPTEHTATGWSCWWTGPGATPLH